MKHYLASLLRVTVSLRRFYQAVVELPLRKAKALDPLNEALAEGGDESRAGALLHMRQQCYDVIICALCLLHNPTATAQGKGSAPATRGTGTGTSTGAGAGGGPGAGGMGGGSQPLSSSAASPRPQFGIER